MPASAGISNAPARSRTPVAAGLPPESGFQYPGCHEPAWFILADSKSVLTISSRRDRGFAGWDARRDTAAIAALLRGFATSQTAREAPVPKGWSAIGRFLCADSCLHPGASGEPSLRTHPDCAPTRLRRDRNHALRFQVSCQPLRSGAAAAALPFVATAAFAKVSLR